MKEKWPVSMRFVWHHWADKHTCCGSPRGEEREKRAERILEEIMTENFPSLIKENMNINIQQPQQNPRWIALSQIQL